MARSKSAPKDKQLYGIAEWYGFRYANLSDDERKNFSRLKNTEIQCPYFAQIPSLGPQSGRVNCNKKGGVCSIRNFVEADKVGDRNRFGPITATCPNRFIENGTIVRHIGKILLGTDAPSLAKEIAFLRRPNSPEAAAAVAAADEDADDEDIGEAGQEPGSEDVGRIDLVFVDPKDASNWCAVEMQAVYFSGGSMAKDIKVIQAHKGNDLPMPGAARRPDFRSSGPKRLLPQLMIKVPTLRRWGKKMVVVVDRPFFEALDHMAPVEHPSNCDIVWVVVDYDETKDQERAVLKIHKTLYTTLEDAVVGLTAGRPTNRPDFESKLKPKVRPAFPPNKPT